MMVTINGIEFTLKDGATLKDAVANVDYEPGTIVSVFKSTESLRTESDDFEVVTTRGRFHIHLDEGVHGQMWKSKADDITGSTARWVTHDIAAFGSFATDIEVDRTEALYRRYDCFFSLGGFDNATTYLMIARDDHRGTYGTAGVKVGRVTRGRHVLDGLREGDSIISIGPVVSESQKDNYVLTSDLSYKLEDGNRVETQVKVRLDMSSPESAEHLMVISQKGYVNVASETGSYLAVDDDMDITFKSESKAVREKDGVFVRSTGVGVGRILFYRERRQMLDGHNHVGDVVMGSSIITSAKATDRIRIVTEPPRLMAVGMTVSEGIAIMEAAGIKVSCDGVTNGDAIVVEQSPENTVDILNKGEVTLTGMDRSSIYRIELNRKKEADVHYFEKITGLNHKPIGSLKVHFWFPGMSMVTFNGDEDKGKSLYPGEPFKKCKRGDIGLTNQACDHKGLIGIRMTDSKEFGPTGEEPFGTNIFGKFADDLKRLEESLDDGVTVYVTELKL